jgi:hypothetical protein
MQSLFASRMNPVAATNYFILRLMGYPDIKVLLI